ncbi:MAG: hypothetical protein KAI73_11180 [Rhodospirillaceae bacterium]|nr:hypothetical protein [Rhodospirillaceae bacterium]
MGSALRLLLLTMSTVIFVGIWLSGYDQVHWLLYAPASFMLFAAITGICPGLIIWRKLGFS